MDPPAQRGCPLGRRAATLLALPLFAVVAWSRLWGLERFEPSVAQFDEGIRLEQLHLMTAGFRPFRDIYASQGPLLLDAFYPLFDRFGRDVPAARLPSALGSLACLVGLYLVGRRLGGWVGPLAALGLLGVSPWFLSVSRLALAETPSLGAACIALWLALRHRADRSWLTLGASAFCLAFAALLKPMAAVVAVPILAALLHPGPSRRLRDAVIWCCVAAAGAGAVLVTLGLDLMIEPFVTYRIGAAGIGARGLSERWTPLTNLQAIGITLHDELPLIGLALAGLLPTACASRRAALVGGSWLAATALMLLFYSPLSQKHAAYLLPPAALLAGTGLDAVLSLGRARTALRRALLIAPLALAGLWYLPNLHPALEANWRSMHPDQELLAPDSDYADALELIGRVSDPSEFVVVDHPYLAFLADRLVPPRLVDTSLTRVLAGALTDDEAIAQTEAFGARAVVFWADRLELLLQYREWVDRTFVLVRTYDSGRAIYVRPEALAATGGPESPRSAEEVRFGDALALTGVRLVPFEGGHSQRVSLRWVALRPGPAENYVSQLTLRRSDGRVAFRRGVPILPGWARADWPADREVDQRLHLDLGTLGRGRYLLTLSLTVGRGEALSATIDPAASVRLSDSADTVELGSISLS